MPQSTLDKILAFVEGSAAMVAKFGPAAGPAGIVVAEGAQMADFFLKLIQAGVQGHEATTGKPFDPTLLHHIDPVA